MKLYVIPVEKDCNANCKFCITKLRDFKKAYLNLKNLELLKKLNINKIEITGGGEPLLHKDINKIIKICSEKAKTQLYTNGALIKKLTNPEKLEYLCLSRAHYLDKENQKIMHINYNFKDILKLNTPIKLSLLLHKSGINNINELKNYFNWALKNKIKKVTVRQLFENTLDKEFISSEDLFNQLIRTPFTQENQSSPKPTINGAILFLNNMEIEFEWRSCACELNNPVLHANGKLIQGWEDIQETEDKKT
jgi:organic radical activating enzyme